MATRRETTARGDKRERSIDFRKIGAIIQKNFIVLIRDKTRIIPLLLFPIFMILVFGFASGNTPKHIATAVVVYDSSPLSQELQQAIADNQAFSVTHVVSTEGEGKTLLDNGAVRAVIIIPAGLQEDLDGGGQAGVTIMVDESDASVAAAAHAALNAVVATESSRISHERLAALQASVDAASQRLLQDNAQQADLYGSIAARTSDAQEHLVESKGMLDAAAQAAQMSIVPPTIYVPAIAGDHPSLSGNNTYVGEPLSNDAARAQVAMLQRSSGLIGVAAQDIQQATLIAKQADAKQQSLADYRTYDQNVLAPMRTIHVFTSYNADSLLAPLTYEEKPAYGTGKRAIDFLIPAIIALTIFQGAVMGMGRAVAGEKREGSLTRVFLTPTSNATIITGTLLFYVVFELFRAAFLIGISMLIFNIKIEGSFLLIGLILVVYTTISAALGMILSSMVKTEQQFMAMAMLVSMPTMFLAGVFIPLQAMPKIMQGLASFLPITYAGDALRGVMIKGFSFGFIIFPFAILLLFLVVTITLLFMAFKRDIE